MKLIRFIILFFCLFLFSCKKTSDIHSYSPGVATFSYNGTKLSFDDNSLLVIKVYNDSVLVGMSSAEFNSSDIPVYSIINKYEIDGDDHVPTDTNVNLEGGVYTAYVYAYEKYVYYDIYTDYIPSYGFSKKITVNGNITIAINDSDLNVFSSHSVYAKIGTKFNKRDVVCAWMIPKTDQYLYDNSPDFNYSFNPSQFIHYEKIENAVNFGYFNITSYRVIPGDYQIVCYATNYSELYDPDIDYYIYNDWQIDDGDIWGFASVTVPSYAETTSLTPYVEIYMK